MCNIISAPLETRKTIERAKGVLMRNQSLSEESAYRLIQRQAMDRRKSMKEVAEAVILSDREIKAALERGYTGQFATAAANRP